MYFQNVTTFLGTPRKRKTFSTPLSERQNEVHKQKVDKHRVKPKCLSTCRKLCFNWKESTRESINSYFWNLNFSEQTLFLKSMTSKHTVARKTSLTDQRKFTYSYFLKNESDEKVNVCQTFFLATLGYDKNNNCILRRIQQDKHYDPVNEKRGKYERDSIPQKSVIIEHIEGFNPMISHYRREHAPHKRYLPSDVTIVKMHSLFLEKYPTAQCSYELYRCVLKEQNISFTQLGHEECELCFRYDEHKKLEIHDEENCQMCIKAVEHKQRSTVSRTHYESFKNIPWSTELVTVSVDLQKIIMLPRMEQYKQVLFAQRLVAYNLSFVPLGKITTEKRPMAVLWHEAIAGRKKEQIISGFYAFLLQNRDVKNIRFFLDNCSAQNKNWCLFSALIYIINSSEVSTESIELNFFEPGHTFMSADSFHHQVELSLKHQNKTYDFNDFCEAVQGANKGRVNVKRMSEFDFYCWTDWTSQHKIKKINPKPYLSNMARIRFKRGNRNMFYSNGYDELYLELNFLQQKMVMCSTLPSPEIKGKCNGITVDKKNNITKNIIPLLPESRRLFWNNLPISVNEEP